MQKGSNFTFDQGLVNHELWLPTGGDVRFSARILLMKGVRQNIHFQNDRYQKFRADAVQQTGVTVVAASQAIAAPQKQHGRPRVAKAAFLFCFSC